MFSSRCDCVPQLCEVPCARRPWTSDVRMLVAGVSTPLYCQSSAVRAVSSPVQQGRGIPRRRIRAAAVKGASALRFCMAFRFCRAPSDLSPYAERLQVFCACRFFVGVSARRVPFVGVSARRVRRGRVSPFSRCQPLASSPEGSVNSKRTTLSSASALGYYVRRWPGSRGR